MRKFGLVSKSMFLKHSKKSQFLGINFGILAETLVGRNNSPGGGSTKISLNIYINYENHGSASHFGRITICADAGQNLIIKFKYRATTATGGKA